MREFLEKHYSAEVAASERETIKLAAKAMLEVSTIPHPPSLHIHPAPPLPL